MEDEDASLDEMQSLRQKSVENDSKEQRGDDKQRSVPSLRFVPGVVQNEKTLDLGTGHIGGERAACLPTEDTKPAYLRYQSASTSPQSDPGKYAPTM